MVPHRKHKKDWECETWTLQFTALDYVSAEIFCFSTMIAQIFPFCTKCFAPFCHFNQQDNFARWRKINLCLLKCVRV